MKHKFQASSQATIHIIFRIVSGMLSLYLFALLARFYPAKDLKDLYFFLLIFGFCVSALRTLVNVSAGLQAADSKVRKIRRIKSAIGEALFVALLLMPVAVWLLGQYVPHNWLLGCAAILLIGAAVDSDPLRALLARPPRFAIAFAFGSALGVLWLSIMGPGHVEYAVIAMLLQWMPVALLNSAVLLRLGCDCFVAGISRLREGAVSLGCMFIVATFDGFVLNLPFLLGDNAPTSSAIDTAIVIRIFSASLMMFPLILHWSNSRMLANLAQYLHMAPVMTYFSLQFAGAIGCGLAFGLVFSWISGHPLIFSQACMFIALATAFCIYTSVAQFNARTLPAYLLAPTLGAIVLITIAVSASHMAQLSLHAFSFIALQCAALLVGALAIQAVARMAVPPVKPCDH